MSLEQIIFYLFSTILIFSSLMVIISRNPIFSALFLILSFVTCSCLWMLAEAEFLAITLVLVYVGAVMVLFMFVVMMLNIQESVSKEKFIKYLPVGLLVSVSIFVEMWLVLKSKNLVNEVAVSPIRHDANYSNTKELGEVLYTQYMFQFELASVILLVAIISAIALTLRKRKNV